MHQVNPLIFLIIILPQFLSRFANACSSHFLFLLLSRTFNSDNALQAHSKAKHGAAKWARKLILDYRVWCTCASSILDFISILLCWDLGNDLKLDSSILFQASADIYVASSVLMEDRKNMVMRLSGFGLVWFWKKYFLNGSWYLNLSRAYELNHHAFHSFCCRLSNLKRRWCKYGSDCPSLICHRTWSFLIEGFSITFFQ